MRFDVHPMPSEGIQGYVIDIQADMLAYLATRAVIPLLPEDVAGTPGKMLHPVFEIGGARYVLSTHELGSVPKNMLKPAIASLGAHETEITRALEVLLTGF